MASRFPRSTLHQRDPRTSSSLFDSYGGDSRPASKSPGRGPGPGPGYSYGAYPGDGYMSGGSSTPGGGYRAATPNAKGHYSDAVLSHLESQNDAEVEGITAKVKMLKDVSCPHCAWLCCSCRFWAFVWGRLTRRTDYPCDRRGNSRYIAYPRPE
jgi:blocked-early-in-transport protein 1